MGTMVNIIAEISPLFSAAQDTAACHQRNALLLRKVYLKSDFQRFYEVFLHPVNLVLQVDLKQKSPYVDRLIEFFGVFCDSLKRKPKQNDQEEEEESFTEDPLITKLFEHLLEASKCSLDTIRFRSCQLINKILDHLVGNDISNELCDQLAEFLVDRLSDPKNVIILQAIVALYRLQDPNDPDDKIIDKLIQLMYDSHAKIRQVCVEKIAARKDVVGHIIKRSRDVDPNVRLAAFKRLSKFSKYLKINDRRTLLFTGLFDASENVKKYVLTQFLSSWLEQYDNIIALMKSIRLDADEDDIKMTVELYDHILNKFYFKTRTLKELNEILILTEEKLIPYEELNWETVSYWKLYVMLLSQDDEMESQLASIIPELVRFCRYIKGYTDFSRERIDEQYLEKQYVIKQLFLIVRTYDLADPVSRQCLHKLVDFVVKKVDLTDDVVETIIGCLELTMPDPNVRCQFGCELISDLLFPIDTEQELQNEQEKKENEFALSKLKVKVNCLQEEQDRAVAAADFIEAERIKHEIEDASSQINNLKSSVYVAHAEDIKRTTDLCAIHKCLDIAWAVLRTAKVRHLTPSLKSLQKDFILEMLIHENEVVRMKALKCYAICCIYDKTTAKNGIHVLAVPIESYQAGEECDTQTLKVCIAAVSDLIRIYGAHLMAEPSEDQLEDSVNEEHQKIFTGGTSLTTLVQGLVDLMDDEQYEIQFTACEGLCKLVLDERIHSSQIISRLVLKWCQPIEQDEPESETVKQLIGYVLERIPYLPGGAEELEGSVLLTINTLAKAPRTSPLADVDIDNIAKFMLALCKLSSQGERIHSNIALSISTKINQHPNARINPIYSKVLLVIDVPNDPMIKNELFTLCEVARENITEKVTYKNITKFMANLVQKSEGDQNMPEIAEEE